jgi:two-component system OmpR family sensor kinase
MTSPGEPERLSLLVHEVRSPVAALTAIAVALTDDGLGEPAARDLLVLAIAACRGIERIVGDAAIGPLRLEDVDLASVAREATAAAALGGARVRAVVDVDGAQVRGDPVRLRQVLDNLVANAAAHSPPEAEVVVTVSQVGESVAVAVSDEGPGIPGAEQARIFEPGVRLDPDDDGLGLGLPVARAIAEAHDGTVAVESAPGRGATFTLMVPLARAPQS